MRTSGKRGARHDGDIGATHDFEQAQGVRDFFIPPRVSAYDRNAEYVHLWGLDQKRERLHIAAAGAGAVFVDDDFTAGLGGAKDGGRQEHCQEERFRCQHF